MTTVAMSSATAPTFRSFANAEWIKLRTVRSTTYTLATAAIVSIGIGAFSCQRLAAELSGPNNPYGPDAHGIDGVSRSLLGGAAAQLALGALGVLVVTSEFGTGMIRASLAAMPQRRQWIAAKLAVFGGVALLVGQVLAFTSFAVGQAILSTQHAGVSLAGSNALRSVVAVGLYVSLIGVLGAAFGLIIRHTAGALSSVLGAVFVLPVLAGALPVQLQHSVVRFLPETIGEQAATPYPLRYHFPAWGGVALMVGYVTALTAVGIWLLQRRDA